MNGLEALDSIRCALSLCPNHNYKKENNLCNIIEKELKVFEIIKNHTKENKHFKYLLYMAKYWEENKVEVTEELLENYDFPYTVDEFNFLKEVMK